MSRLTAAVLVLIASAAISGGRADTPPGPDYPSPDYASLKPSLAVVIGILTIMFALTFLLLVYAKFCHGPAPEARRPAEVSGCSGRLSGVDKAVIESLPLFRFSSLKGSREGLECAVCLSRFDDSEVLRMLPKCRHAFHAGCVDRWLESRSTCPLCRSRVASDDLRLVSSRALELFVHREESRGRSSSSSFRKIENEDDGESGEPLDRRELDKHSHRIVVSSFGNRWSSVTSSDLLFLSSEMMMMNDASFERFPGNSTATFSGQQRSVSEITAVSRIRVSEETEGDERVRSVWLPIARRTVQWFANSQEENHLQRHSLDV